MKSRRSKYDIHVHQQAHFDKPKVVIENITVVKDCEEQLLELDKFEDDGKGQEMKATDDVL